VIPRVGGSSPLGHPKIVITNNAVERKFGGFFISS
jgi:hypothetical protein